MKEFRPAIIRMHENGYSVREIAEILSVPKSTVHDDIKRFEEMDLNADRIGRGKTSKARTEENIRKVARLTQKEESQFFTKLITLKSSWATFQISFLEMKQQIRLI